MALANQLLQLLPTLTDLVLHDTPCHSAMRQARLPDVFSLLPQLNMIVCQRRNPLLILPNEIRDIPHRHRQEGPRSHGSERQRRSGPEEDPTVARDDRPCHGSDNHIHTPRHEMLAGVRRGRQRSNGVGEGILDMQGAGQEVVEAVLDSERVVIEEDTGLADLSSQDIGGGRRR